MTLTEHFVPEERVVKRIIGEIILNLQPKNIENVFHLPRMDQIIRLTHEQVERWYWEYIDEASEIIQSSYLIEKNPLGNKMSKVDIKRRYMKEDIR